MTMASDIAKALRPIVERATHELTKEMQKARQEAAHNRRASDRDAKTEKGTTETFKVRQMDATLAFTPPFRANPLDAGLDIAASEPNIVPKDGGVAIIHTNLVVAVPPGHMGMVVPRSGNAMRYGVTVTNSPGIIDSGYRGEVKILLTNHGPADFNVEAGDRVAQLILVPVSLMPVEVVPTLKAGERGTNGFGSSGR